MKLAIELVNGSRVTLEGSRGQVDAMMVAVTGASLWFTVEVDGRVVTAVRKEHIVQATATA